MTALAALGIFNYGLVLIYGLFLSVFISGGWETRRQRAMVFAACPIFLLIQSFFWLTYSVDTAKQLYPLIVHLPLVLILIFVLKKRVGVAVVSVCTAYLCCQLPRWVNLVVTAVTRSPLAGEISYTLVIVPIFILLCRLFARPAYAAMTASPNSMLLFGSLPVAYYFFDYATVIYSDALYHVLCDVPDGIPCSEHQTRGDGNAEFHAGGRTQAVADRNGRAAPLGGADGGLSARHAPSSEHDRWPSGGGTAAAGGGIH